MTSAEPTCRTPAAAVTSRESAALNSSPISVRPGRSGAPARRRCRRLAAAWRSPSACGARVRCRGGAGIRLARADRSASRPVLSAPSANAAKSTCAVRSTFARAIERIGEGMAATACSVSPNGALAVAVVDDQRRAACARRGAPSASAIGAGAPFEDRAVAPHRACWRQHPHRKSASVAARSLNARCPSRSSPTTRSCQPSRA